MTDTTRQALIFAAMGAIASGVARQLAADGYHVWASGRSAERLAPSVAEVRAAGGQITPLEVDATDPAAVSEAVSTVIRAAGRLDAVFNGIGRRPSELHYPAFSAGQSLAEFMVPLEVIVGSQFLTARTAAAAMAEHGGGAIVILSATLSGMTAPFMAGISAACGAVEALTRSLAGEFGRSGVRVNCVRGSGMPETRTIQETGAGLVALVGSPPPMALPPIGRPITVAETANAAAFLASERASGMTGQVVTVCGGAFV